MSSVMNVPSRCRLEGGFQTRENCGGITNDGAFRPATAALFVKVSFTMALKGIGHFRNVGRNILIIN